MKKALILSGLLLTMGGVPMVDPALTQTSATVQFKPGNYGTIVSGSITGREYSAHKLRASKGQKLFAELSVAGTNGNGSAYFNILPPPPAATVLRCISAALIRKPQPG